MNISDLKENIVFQVLSVTQNKYGDVIDDWTDFFSCHGSVKVISGKELYEARKTNSENQFKVQLRYCKKISNINPQDFRIIWKGQIYKILPPIENIDNSELRFNIICYESGIKMENDFAADIMKVIGLEIENAKKEAEKICRKNAEELAEKLQENSPSDTGYYAKGWKAKKTYENMYSVEYSTVNVSRQATLSYLLENGHIAANGKRVGKRPHIKPGAEEQTEKFVNEIKDTFGTEQG